MASAKEGKLALIIFAVAIFFSYAHPYHIHPYRTFYHDLIICLGLLSAMAFFVIRPSSVSEFESESGFAPASRTTVRLRFPALLALPGAIILLILLQVALGMITPASFVALPILYLLLFALAMVFGSSLALEQGGLDMAVSAIALASLLAASVSLVFQHIQILGLDATPVVMYIAKDPAIAMRPYANVAQPNQLALLYFFALAGLWHFYRTRTFSGFSSIAIAALLLWGAVLTQSRIGWILVPLFFAYTASKLGTSKRKGTPVIIAMLALVTLYAVLTFCLPQISQAIGFSGGSVADHVGGRSERTGLWQTAWQLAAQHPWLGVGWFGFGPGQVSVGADFTSSTYAEHAHNLPLNLAAELGWPATILIMGGLCWWFYQTCIRYGKSTDKAVVKSTAENNAKSTALQFCTLSLFAVGVHSMVEFPLWYAFVLIPVGVLMGMVHQLRWPAAGTVVRPGIVLAGFAIGCILLAAVTLDYQRVVTGFKSIRDVSSGFESKEKFLQKPAFTLFPQFFEYFKLTRIKPREGMSAEEINYMETWAPRFGFVHILNIEAEVYALNGQPKKAARSMLTLQRLHPIPYPEYYDYWKAKAEQDPRYQAVFETMPARDAP
ncbi:Wzy polymerase domain-containing protein [Undibacterium sp. Tian12W]|uniref:PglL family O-oligosaccharyltransferase n=1 Tax=Undibacterium sp. Tian12W TaxID=3413054 RepID=UPI003BF0FEDF